MPNGQFEACAGSFGEATAMKLSGHRKVPGRGWMGVERCPKCGKMASVMPNGRLARHSPKPLEGPLEYTR